MHRRQIITIFLSLNFLQRTVIAIVNRKKVADDAMPYMVSVQSMQSHKCGGFLVSENLVLTAAHCSYYNPDEVVLGSHNLKSRKKQYINIEKAIKHPSFEEWNKKNNLMLLKLKTKAKLGKGVQIIQLPNENMEVEAGDWCEIAGWGAIEIGKANVKDLYATSVSIMDLPTCQTKWPNLPPHVICAARNNNIRTFSEADCGGPLVCNNIAVGIMSFNRDGRIEGPNVFVDIIQYLQWINQVVADRGGSERMRVCEVLSFCDKE